MSPLAEVAWVFARLGTIAFGGPAAHIAIFERECVDRRRWLDHQRFLDLLGITNLIPGPNSTEMAMHIGFIRAGIPGLLVAGTAFVLPAAVMTAAITAIYVRWGTLPDLAPCLAGIKPVVAALIILALWKLGEKALKNRTSWIIAVLCLAGIAAGLSEVQVLLLAAASAIRMPARPKDAAGTAAALFPFVAPAAASVVSLPTVTSLSLFFLKVGAILYGSGYVLIAFLQADLVERWGWLSQQQLLDAVAIGQMTPGPILTTATAIGWILLGARGALLATVAIFAPGFLYVGLAGPLLERIRAKPAVARFLLAVNAAAVALMAVAAWRITSGACASPGPALLAVAALAVLLRTKISPGYLVLAGAAVGRLAHFT